MDEYRRQGEGARSTTWVIGMLTTKDHPEVLAALLRPGDRACFVPVPGHQTAAPQELAAEAHRVYSGLRCATATDGFEALDWATQAVGDPRLSPIVLCGSLYLIGDMLAQRHPELLV